MAVRLRGSAGLVRGLHEAMAITPRTPCLSAGLASTGRHTDPEEERIMTSMIRWNTNPARELLGLRDDVDRLFESVFSTRLPVPADSFAPPVDIVEAQDGFTIRVDLPGVNQKDVKVSLLGDQLTIRGERQQTRETKGESVHRVERRYGSFERTFTLGVAVRADQVKASYRDGVLEVQVPKAEEAKVREIEVQVAS
jgi:HSP20 family protein